MSLCLKMLSGEIWLTAFYQEIHSCLMILNKYIQTTEITKFKCKLLQVGWVPDKSLLKSSNELIIFPILGKDFSIWGNSLGFGFPALPGNMLMEFFSLINFLYSTTTILLFKKRDLLNVFCSL